jgi:hypothetical protein
VVLASNCQPRNRGSAYIVAAGEFIKRRSARALAPKLVPQAASNVSGAVVRIFGSTPIQAIINTT